MHRRPLSPHTVTLARERVERGVRLPPIPDPLNTPYGRLYVRDAFILRAAEELARLDVFLLRYPELAPQPPSDAELLSDWRTTGPHP